MRAGAEDHPASTPSSSGHKKTTGRPPATRVHAAPTMNDDSDVDAPTAVSKDCNPPAVTHTRRQVQALNKSTSARRSIRASQRIVPDDEEEEIEEDRTDQEDEDEDEDAIYGGLEGSAGDALGSEVGQLSIQRVFRYMLADNQISLLARSF